MYLTRSGYFACEQHTFPRTSLLFLKISPLCLWSADLASDQPTLLRISEPLFGISLPQSKQILFFSCKESLPNHAAAFWVQWADQSLVKLNQEKNSQINSPKQNPIQIWPGQYKSYHHLGCIGYIWQLKCSYLFWTYLPNLLLLLLYFPQSSHGKEFGFRVNVCNT